MLQNIVEANHTDWDHKLHCALWACRTNHSTGIRSTVFRLAFGLEAIMPLDFIVPSLWIQIEYNMNEFESK